MSDDRDSRPTIDERRGSTPGSAPAEPGPAQPSRPALPASGRYEARGEIARGGMGRVVEATDTVLGRTVAVKEALAGGDDALRRFQREIHITARLEHPSIVPVHDAGTSPDGSPFYVMRKVSGRPLNELIDGAETIDARLALLPHVVAAAQALAHAHRRGVVHRDIKPSNILVGELGETIVIDWGLAKVIGEPDDDDPHAPPPIDPGSSLRTRIGTVFGTPGFMSPEQLRGEAVDARTDVYALGATLYFLFVREPPHADPDEDEMMAAAAAGPPASIAGRVPGLPRELSTIVDTALAYDTTVRYPDAGALAEDLQRFLTGQLVASHRYSPRERLTRFVRRNRVAVAIAGVALATVAIGAWVAIGSVLAERDRADVQARLATARQHEAEDAREREQERGDQLLLTQARTLVTTNPTAAVALLKQLVTPPERWATLWRQARSVAAAARGAGVAKGMRAPTNPGNVVLARDGKHAAVITRRDGLTLYDLDALTSRPIAFDRARGAVFAGTDRLVMWSPPTIGILDLRTGALRTVTAPNHFDGVQASSTTLYWHDDAHEVWRLAIAGGSPERVDLGDRVSWVVLSPDGRWLLDAGDHGLRLVDLTATTLAPHVLAASFPTVAHWDDTSASIIALAGTEIVRYWVDGRSPLRYSLGKAIAVQALAIGERIYVMTSLGPRVIAPTYDLPFQAGKPGAMVGLVVDVAGHAVIPTGGSLVVMSDRSFELHSASGAITSVAGNPDSPRVVALTPGHLLMWTLDEPIPEARATVKQAASYTILSDELVLANSMNDGWHWLDLAHHTDRQLELPQLASVVGAGGEPVALIRPVTTDDRDKLVYVRGPDLPVLVWHEHASAALLLDDGRAVLATERGELVSYDRDGRRAVWFAHPSRPVDFTQMGTWIVMAYADGTVIRHDARSGATEQTTIASRVELRAEIAPDGTVFIGAGKTVMRWQRDGLLLVHTIIPERIDSLVPMSNHVLVRTRDGGTYTVTHAAPAEVKTLPSGSRWSWFSADAELGISDNEDGQLEILDIVSGTTWPAAMPVHDAFSMAPQLSESGRLAAAIIGPKLYVWDLGIPATAAETARWLDTLTNATAELGTSTLTFH